jgi:hypothetical protein
VVEDGLVGVSFEVVGEPCIGGVVEGTEVCTAIAAIFHPFSCTADMNEVSVAVDISVTHAPSTSFAKLNFWPTVMVETQSPTCPPSKA